MPELKIEVRSFHAASNLASPAIALELGISNHPFNEPIHSVILRCQIQIETPRRRYSATEQVKLRDLFGEPERWGQTLRPVLWTNVITNVPAFTGSAIVTVLIPCTFDLQETATKYFHGIQDGTVPLTLLFSGTVFYESSGGQLQAAPISWNTEARAAFPVDLWKQAIDLHYPNLAWLSVRRDIFERLYDFKVREGLATFDEALDRLMEAKLEVGA